MATDPDATSVQFDVGVANVGDGLFDSQVIVAALGDLTCEECGSCETCPGNPICQPTCQEPPLKSCDFYSKCAEAALKCGPSGYPINYGTKNCYRFQSNLGDFSPQGQGWIWAVMNCLQKSLVGPVGECDATCDGIKAVAFDSHPKCYVDSGLCSLPPEDFLQIILTVNTDLFAGPAVKQAVSTVGGCANQYLGAIEAEINDLLEKAVEEVVNAAVYLAKVVVLRALKRWFESLLEPPTIQ
jgi:hypothetical protein